MMASTELYKFKFCLNKVKLVLKNPGEFLKMTKTDQKRQKKRRTDENYIMI